MLCTTRLRGPFTATTDAPLVVAVILCPGHNTRSFTSPTIARDIAIQYLDRESRLLRDVRSALGRIDEGTFGTCLHCEEDISRRRLEAMPWAKLCLPCQEAADRGEQGVIETVESWFADAA